MKMKLMINVIALSIPLAFGSGCGSDDDSNNANNNTNNTTNNSNNTTPSEVIEINDSITEDTTWEAGTYRVNPFNFEVEGGTLSIEPCTTIHVDTKIRVLNGGNIVAIGEEDCPITFTSAEDSPSPGDWEYLDILASADNDNVFEHVIFEYAGNNEGAVQVRSGAAFRSTTVRHTAALGLGVYDGTLFDFTDMSFESIVGFPVSLIASQVQAVDGITINDVQNERILVRDGQITEPNTWAPQSIPYEINDPSNKLQVESDLTIEAGTQLLISGDGGIRVRADGSLTLNGVEDNPIVIESAKQPQAAGDWNQINFVTNAKPSSLTWTTIRHGGGNQNTPSGPGVLKTDNTAIELDNVIFDNGPGCDVHADEGLVTATNSTYSECN